MMDEDDKEFGEIDPAEYLRAIALKVRIEELFKKDLREPGRVMSSVQKALGIRVPASRLTEAQLQRIHTVFAEVYNEAIVMAARAKKDYPTAEHAADAMIQLVIQRERRGFDHGL